MDNKIKGQKGWEETEKNQDISKGTTSYAGGNASGSKASAGRAESETERGSKSSAGRSEESEENEARRASTGSSNKSDYSKE